MAEDPRQPSEMLDFKASGVGVTGLGLPAFLWIFHTLKKRHENRGRTLRRTRPHFREAATLRERQSRRSGCAPTFASASPKPESVSLRSRRRLQGSARTRAWREQTNKKKGPEKGLFVLTENEGGSGHALQGRTRAWHGENKKGS